MRMTTPRLHIHLIIALAVIGGNEAAAQSSSFFNSPGIQHSRDYVSMLPFEHFDPSTGSMVLTFTDLELPGNAGRSLRFQRTYNSKSGLWTFGLTGHVMTVFDGWPQGASITVPPTFFTADGGQHRAALWLNAANQGNDSYRKAATDTFWQYDRETRELKLPDGTVSQFDSSGRLVSSTDPFGNAVHVIWEAGQVRVQQVLGTNPYREVVLALAGLPSPTAVDMPASMTYGGRTWEYAGLPALPLQAVAPPDGPGWAFAYEQNALTVTTPHGGRVRYDYATKEFQQPDGSLAFTTVLDTRTATDGTTSTVWKYTYVLPGAGQPTSTDVRLEGATRRTVFDYEWVAAGAGVGPYAMTEYAGRTYALMRRTEFGSDDQPVEREERTYHYHRGPQADTPTHRTTCSRSPRLRGPRRASPTTPMTGG
jgi:hypothetical protein